MKESYRMLVLFYFLMWVVPKWCIPFVKVNTLYTFDVLLNLKITLKLATVSFSTSSQQSINLICAKVELASLRAHSPLVENEVEGEKCF